MSPCLAPILLIALTSTPCLELYVVSRGDNEVRPFRQLYSEEFGIMGDLSDGLHHAVAVLELCSREETGGGGMIWILSPTQLL